MYLNLHASPLGGPRLSPVVFTVLAVLALKSRVDKLGIKAHACKPSRTTQEEGLAQEANQKS